ncbi:chromogranin-A isoform X1 [Arapaima gigas]
MISTGCVLFSILLSSAARSQPVATERADTDTPQVMKCILEVLADTLADPQHPAVSQRCLELLSTDERIASILHHQNLLRELHEVAVQADANDRTPRLPQGHQQEHSHVTENPGSKPASLSTTNLSMLAVLGTSGQQTVEMTQRTQGGAKRLGQQGLEGEAESEENSKEEHRGGRPPAEDTSMHSGKEEAEDKNQPSSSEKKENSAEVNKGTVAGLGLQDAEKSSAKGEQGPGEEWAEEKAGGNSGKEEFRKKKNKDVHLMDVEMQSRAVTLGESEEGSASSRSEENEIERLAAIESELGNLAWRLHQLQRG